jgi:parallel beta-helix repeat protein
VLESGVYKLAGPLEIRKPLTLTGAGMDETLILSEAGGYALRFVGAGPFTLKDLTIQHEGEAEADVVVVQGGLVDFARCRFSGAYRTVDGGDRAGLRLLGSTAGAVQDSEFVENVSIGLLVVDQAQPTLERNVCTDNEMIGIAYRDSSGGAARRNDCSGSQVAGIHVKGQAQPLLEGNHCVGNGSGIIFLENGGGIARKNECSGNGFVGISVGNQAEPLLEENACNSNQYGIVFGGTEGGTARQNEATKNSIGLLIGEDANPELEDNSIRDNDEEDIRDLRP